MKFWCSNINIKVEQHHCIPYNLPAPPIHGLSICSGDEEKAANNESESEEEECLDECHQRYFSASMSALTKFEDPGDFFYSTLLRRPGPSSPVESPKFWAEYVQYVNSLGNSTVLGPPRCHTSFQFERNNNIWSLLRIRNNISSFQQGFIGAFMPWKDGESEKIK